MGAAFDMGKELPPPDYWEEVNPLLTEWWSVNNSKCPECHRVIKINMSRHLRLVHTQFVCYWRYPVPACPSWFSSELNGKDHIENTHRFREGCGHSFFEYLQQFGLEWFGSRSFFDQRKGSGQSLWEDFRPGVAKLIYNHRQPWSRAVKEILQGHNPSITPLVHRCARHITPTEPNVFVVWPD